jgi:hypothetical protein
MSRGFIQRSQKWVTPLEKFRIEQTAKGLVEYRGTWMTKDEAFTAEQLAKGLVLHQGKWMTPEEQMEAKGFVMFEGMWVTPAERDQVLAQRREQQRLAAARAEAERQRVVRDAEQRRREQARIEQLKVDAYTRVRRSRLFSRTAGTWSARPLTRRIALVRCCATIISASFGRSGMATNGRLISARFRTKRGLLHTARLTSTQRHDFRN